MKKSDFHFDLPAELIAQQPLAQRSASRLLVVDAAADTLTDRQMTELPDCLRPGDLLVFNDTRVLPARLFGHKESGGAVEILIERVTGFDTPYPHSLEWAYFPGPVRITEALKKILKD